MFSVEHAEMLKSKRGGAEFTGPGQGLDIAVLKDRVLQVGDRGTNILHPDFLSWGRA